MKKIDYVVFLVFCCAIIFTGWVLYRTIKHNSVCSDLCGEFKVFSCIMQDNVVAICGNSADPKTLVIKTEEKK